MYHPPPNPHRPSHQTMTLTIPRKDYLFEAGSMAVLNTTAFSPRKVSRMGYRRERGG